MRYLLRLFMVTLTFLLSLPVLATSEEERLVWRFGLEEIDGSVQDIYAKEFKRRIEEKSAGQGSLVPEMQVFNIPYIFSQDDKLNQSVLTNNSTLYEVVGNALIDQDLRLMTFYLEGDMVWSTDTEIVKPDDFKDFRMRVMNSPLVIESFRVYGADTIPLPYSQVYGALQANIVNGQSNPVFSIEEMKFYEVTEYMIWPGKQKFTTSVIANQAWYLSLSAEHKMLLRDTFEEMSDFIFEKQQALNKAQLAKIKEFKPSMTFIILTRAQQNAFKKYAAPIRARYVELAGQPGERLLKALDEALGNKN
ncbi:TRAP transporter substrate-binding protein DctP [Grimontia marina]|uniref:2,3-diketo-L-gulonate-binding periplasmic protein YiaO n=1 Tax=Grimontia marina TaxID=646534 RepID=A0A128FGR5_9GAMM|nr:TRAP transporter substrate-binding protein DctP [Grimontia marina]CZF85987.1 2,3-diketo-L-gulonate-binding periplasmic protein YiaO precursor [Grimontia marina]